MNLKKLLREHDVSAAQVSRATKIPMQTLSNWLAGQKPRDIAQVKRLADHFAVSVDTLCFGPMLTLSERDAMKTYEDEIVAGVYEVVLRKIKKPKG